MSGVERLLDEGQGATLAATVAATLALLAADYSAPAGERADALVELVRRAVPYPGDLAALRVELVALILEGEAEAGVAQ